MYYPSAENKGADQLCSYCTADLRLCFHICRLLVFSCEGSIYISVNSYGHVWMQLSFHSISHITLFQERHQASRKYEPQRDKNRIFPYAKTKVQISFTVTAKLISAFVITTRRVQFFFFLNPKLQASSPLL